MSDLDQQIQALVQLAPPDGVSPELVAAFGPSLKHVAGQLRFLEYYILQSVDGRWVVATMQNEYDPTESKNIIYAYPTLKDVTTGPNFSRDPDLMALPLPVTHILFQAIALDPVDSLVFFEVPGDLTQAAEVQRAHLQAMLEPLTGSAPPQFA